MIDDDDDHQCQQIIKLSRKDNSHYPRRQQLESRLQTGVIRSEDGSSIFRAASESAKSSIPRWQG